MFDKITTFYEGHTSGCRVAIGCVAGIAVCIPLIKWMCRGVARAVADGINDSNEAHQ